MSRVAAFVPTAEWSARSRFQEELSSSIRLISAVAHDGAPRPAALHTPTLVRLQGGHVTAGETVKGAVAVDGFSEEVDGAAMTAAEHILRIW